MIKKLLGSLKATYVRQKQFSNPREVIFSELKRKESYIVEIEDKKFQIRDSKGDLAVINEIYFRGDYDSYNFQKFDTIIDVGAHIGGFCIKFSDSAERIYSFEPNSQTFRVLEKNLELNEIKNIELFNKAVSSKEGEIEFYSNSNSLRSSLEIKEDEEPSERVDVLNLHSVLDDIDLKGETLLKLDCEGSEFKIIKETDKNTLNKFDAIFLEWHGDAGNPKEIEEILDSHGFDIVENKEEREIENNVGFIYAKSKPYM